MQCQSTLILFEKSRNFDSKSGHEPPDSDLRLQITYSQYIISIFALKISSNLAPLWRRMKTDLRLQRLI